MNRRESQGRKDEVRELKDTNLASSCTDGFKLSHVRFKILLEHLTECCASIRSQIFTKDLRHLAPMTITYTRVAQCRHKWNVFLKLSGNERCGVFTY